MATIDTLKGGRPGGSGLPLSNLSAPTIDKIGPYPTVITGTSVQGSQVFVNIDGEYAEKWLPYPATMNGTTWTYTLTKKLNPGSHHINVMAVKHKHYNSKKTFKGFWVLPDNITEVPTILTIVNKTSHVRKVTVPGSRLIKGIQPPYRIESSESVTVGIITTNAHELEVNNKSYDCPTNFIIGIFHSRGMPTGNHSFALDIKATGPGGSTSTQWSGILNTYVNPQIIIDAKSRYYYRK